MKSRGRTAVTPWLDIFADQTVAPNSVHQFFHARAECCERNARDGPKEMRALWSNMAKDWRQLESLELQAIEEASAAIAFAYRNLRVKMNAR